MYSHALGWAFGSYRPKTRHSDRPVRSLALHVLLRAIEDLFGIHLEVRLTGLTLKTSQQTFFQPRLERRAQRQRRSDQKHPRRDDRPHKPMPGLFISTDRLVGRRDSRVSPPDPPITFGELSLPL